MRLIAIGGCGRSGTTLLQKLLCSHSQIAGGPELDHTKSLFSLYREMIEPWRLARQSYFYDRARLDDLMRNFYMGLLAGARERKPTARWLSEKTPSNIDVAEMILELFPDSAFIAVVRDGRDVVLSHLDIVARYRAQGRPLEDPDMWALPMLCHVWNATARRWLELTENDRFCHRIYGLRFEHLIADPAAELGRLLAFLGLALEDRLLAPEKIHESETGVVLDNRYFTPELYRQPFNPEKVGRWRKGLTSMQKTFCNVAMGPMLSRTRYDLEPSYLRLARACAKVTLDPSHALVRTSQALRALVRPPFE